MISWDQTFINIAREVAVHSTCCKLKVGAVIVKDKRVLSTGYNGVISGASHCEDMFVKDSPEHEAWSIQNELHGELNAILHAAKSGISVDGATIYITVSPCNTCARAIIATGIKRVVYNGPDRSCKYDDGIAFLKNHQKTVKDFEILHLE